jgi:hypothetical protein
MFIPSAGKQLCKMCFQVATESGLMTINLETSPAGTANLPIGGMIGENNNASLETGDPRNTSDPRGLKGWHSRGYLPHYEDAVTLQHVTFHLADSLPKKLCFVWMKS